MGYLHSDGHRLLNLEEKGGVAVFRGFQHDAVGGCKDEDEGSQGPAANR